MAPSDFPAVPVPPAELLERYLQGALDELAAFEGARHVEAAVGLLLSGEGGGEWVLALSGGRLRLRPGSRAEAAVTLVQPVEHWRGALWEARGGRVGRILAGLFRAPRRSDGADGPIGAAAPVALEALGKLDALLRLRLRGPGAERWHVDLKLGPGALPAKPTTVVSLAAEDADRLLAGDLDPVEAFMRGRVRLRGDLGVLLRLQSAGRRVGQALAAARPPAAPGPR